MRFLFLPFPSTYFVIFVTSLSVWIEKKKKTYDSHVDTMISFSWTRFTYRIIERNDNYCCILNKKQKNTILPVRLVIWRKIIVKIPVLKTYCSCLQTTLCPIDYSFENILMKKT